MASPFSCVDQTIDCLDVCNKEPVQCQENVVLVVELRPLEGGVPISTTMSNVITDSKTKGRKI